MSKLLQNTLPPGESISILYTLVMKYWIEREENRLDLHGFTESTVLFVAQKSLDDIDTKKEDLIDRDFDFRLVDLVRHNMARVKSLPGTEEPAILNPEPHRLDDVLDAADEWVHHLETRLLLAYNLDIVQQDDDEETEMEFPGFPHEQVEAAAGDRPKLLNLWDTLLEFSVSFQLQILKYAQTVETVAEGVILKELLQTSLPIEDWLEYREQHPPESVRYRQVLELFDAINTMNRAARQSEEHRRVFFRYPWIEISAAFWRYRVLN